MASVTERPEMITPGGVASGRDTVGVSHQESASLWRRISRFDTLPVRVLVLLIVLAVLSVSEAVRLTSLFENDIWWHLRTGDWILQNHAFPHTGLFTQYPNQPWISYSWGFEIIASFFYKLLGLRGIPVLLMVLQAGLAVSLVVLSGGQNRSFWAVPILVAIALYTVPYTPVRPVMLTFSFSSIELRQLWESRRRGDIRLLYWLPALFLLWANLHIQFVYGLLYLGVLFAAIAAEEFLRRTGIKWFQPKVRLPLRKMAVLTGLSFVATLLTPYSYHLYEVMVGYAKNKQAYNYIVELLPMNFREWQHYTLMVVVMLAFFSLGRTRALDLFKVTLLIVTAAVSFHTQRDAWLVLFPGIAVLADALSGEHTEEPGRAVHHKWARPELIAVALLPCVLVLAVIIKIPSDRQKLLAIVNRQFPVAACDYIRSNHLPQPLYNTLDWGGFILWYLPDYPVAMDGRNDLYGEELDVRQISVLLTRTSPDFDPALMRARTVLMEKRYPLNELLLGSPLFAPVFDDGKSIVFLRVH